MRPRIIIILPDSTPLYVKAGKLKKFFLKDTTILSRELSQKDLIGIWRISGIQTPVLHVVKLTAYKLGRYPQCTAQIGSIQRGNFFHDNRYVVSRLIINQQLSGTVVYHAPARILNFFQKCIAVGILPVVIIQYLQGKQANNKKSNYRQDDTTYDISSF